MELAEIKQTINSARGIVFSYHTKGKWRRAYIAQADTKIGMTIHDLDNPKPDSKNFLYCWQFSSAKAGYDTILERAAIFIKTIIENDYKLSDIMYKENVVNIGHQYPSSSGCPFA